MKNLNDYIIDYCINESMINICNNEQINEGKIIDGIKKLWKWITRKNKKKKINSNKYNKINHHTNCNIIFFLNQ